MTTVVPPVRVEPAVETGSVPIHASRATLEEDNFSVVNKINPEDIQPDLEGWIPANVNKRVCKQFVHKKDRLADASGDLLCHCGYPGSRHTAKAQDRANPSVKEWSVYKHTEGVTTDAFGDLEFVGYGQKISKFVRIDHLSDENRILKLMLEHWKLQHPNLLISVTGGAKNFHMRPRLKEVFNRGLMKAAASTGAWIVTGGMHAGVMKHVGQAVQDYVTAHGQKASLNVIGITPWGCVNNKESLVDPDGSWPAQYRVEAPKQRRQSPIDRNHSHFIFVDNGTQLQYGTEIAFRAKLERAISLMKTDTGDSAVSVPVVCVVLEGGPGTLETVKSAIQNGTPAVVVEGSGRAADILAFAYANSREEDVEVTDNLGKVHKKSVAIVDDEIWEEVARRIEQEWRSSESKELAQRISWVKDCLEHRDHMTIFRLDSRDTKDIDVAILRALLKVNKDQSLDQLKLALAWNRIDVAKSDIFIEEKKWDPGELHEVMYSALLNNQTDFVDLFMENGCSLREFLTLKTMLQLYNNVPNNSVLYTLLEKERNKRDKYFSFEDIGSVIQNLTGDFYYPLYLRDPRYKHANACEILEESCPLSEEDTDDVKAPEKSGKGVDDTMDLKKLESSKQMAFSELRSTIGGTNLRTLLDTQTGEIYKRRDFDEPARELFVWAILLNRPEMAMFFWTEGKEAIASALLAQRLLKSLLTKTDDSELIKSLEASLEHFENAAVGLLTQCYASHEKKAQMLLVRTMANYGNCTIMQLAVKADNIQFIAHTACQALLTNIWQGKMAADTTGWQIAASVFCPPLLFWLITFRKDHRLELTEQKTGRDGDSRKKTTVKGSESELFDDSGDTYGSKQKLVNKNRIKPSKADEPTSVDHNFTAWQRVKYFYNAPVITFCHNCISSVIFLGMYSVILLCNFHTTMNGYEYFLCFWVFTLFVEEMRQIIADESSSGFKKFGNYIGDTWNKMDVLTIVTFVLGMILRNIPASGTCTDRCLHWARIVLAINLMTFCFRMLHMFSVHKQLGPKLVMIGRMMIDLFYFVIVLMVFIVAYGLASQAILYPNTPFSAGLIRKILKKPYFQMYGELFLEELEGEIPCSNDPLLYLNGTIERCPQDTDVVPVLMGIYILITNVLMLNLLIAMFSNTFESVQKNSDGVWKSIYYTMVHEYDDRPPLAAPILIIAHVFLFFRWLCHRTGIRRSAPSEHGFRMTLTDAPTKQLVLWEKMNVDEYMRQSASQEAASMENQVKETNDRVDQLSIRLEEMAESSFMLQSASAGPTTSSQGAKLPPALDERISYLEEQMKRTSRALDWIIQSMVERGTGSQTGPPQLTDIDQMREEAVARRQTQAAKEKEQYKELFRKQLDLHIKARSSHYPCSYQAVLRFNVPNANVRWEEEWSDYEPVKHTDRCVLEGPDWADPVDLLAFDDSDRPAEYMFNAFDGKYNVERTSHHGTYDVVNNLPLNPKGRTGLIGRGLLGRWGPNHASDPIVTRWCKNERGEPIRENGKKVLEFVAIFRQDSKQWAIPGGMLRHGLPVHACLKIEFSEEALGTIVKDESSKTAVRGQLDELFSQGEEVYRGYADDHRNTDHAWVETIAMNYHDDEGSITKPFELKAGENVEMVRWMKILSRQSLYGGHLAILQSLARKKDAAF